MKVILVLWLSIRRSHSLLTQHKVCVIPGWLGLSGNLDKCLARICKRLWSPGIDSEESIPPACVAWRAGTTNRAVVPAPQDGNRFLGPLKGLRIRAQDFRNDAQNTVHWFNAEFQLLMKFTLGWDNAACCTLQISGYSLKKKKKTFSFCILAPCLWSVCVEQRKSRRILGGKLFIYIFLGKTCLLISYVTGQFPEESVSKTNAHCFGKSTNNISKGFKVYYDFIFSNGMS